MKIKVKNHQIMSVINLCNDIYSQRMNIYDKLKMKENIENLIKKQTILEDLKRDLILCGGSTDKLDNLFNLEVEISINIMSLDIIKKFETRENTDLNAIAILSGIDYLPEEKEISEENNNVAKDIANNITIGWITISMIIIVIMSAMSFYQQEQKNIKTDNILFIHGSIIDSLKNKDDIDIF